MGQPSRQRLLDIIAAKDRQIAHLEARVAQFEGRNAQLEQRDAGGGNMQEDHLDYQVEFEISRHPIIRRVDLHVGRCHQWGRRRS